MPPETATSAPASLSETVTLDTPIQRGDQAIATVQLRKPKAGELRGLNLQAVAQGDVNAMIVLLPRITVPQLFQQEVEGLGIEDIGAMAGVVMGFLCRRPTGRRWRGCLASKIRGRRRAADRGSRLLLPLAALGAARDGTGGTGHVAGPRCRSIRDEH